MHPRYRRLLIHILQRYTFSPGKKRTQWIFIAGVLSLFLFIVIADIAVNQQTRNFVYRDAASIPANKVGLLLGTSKYLRSGNPNQYFEYRILAAEQLYK